MSLLRPGDGRAGELFLDAALVAAMVRVETAWLDALVTAGIAPRTAELTAPSPDEIAATAADGGNPVIPLVAALRAQIDDEVAPWVHRGLTSQDVLDTALMSCAADLCAFLRERLAEQVRTLADLATRHRDTPMTARTLTQPAIPTTFGAKAATWLAGILDAAAELDRTAGGLPVQLGGAAGTRAAAAYLAGGTESFAADVARVLGLQESAPWHTNRLPVTRLADALTGLTAAYTHVANDVLLLGRPEFGEVSEGRRAGRGTSSAMPHKANPVLSVLIRRAGLAAPMLGAQLHLASAEVVDERPDGAWHLEWEPLQLLARHTAEAAAETSDLLAGLHVDPERMAANLAAAGDAVHSERAALAELLPDADNARAEAYADAAGILVDTTVTRARAWLEQA